jgi:hypothetical protein
MLPQFGPPGEHLEGNLEMSTGIAAITTFRQAI